MVWNSALIVNINQRRKNEREAAPEMAQREDSLLKLMSKSLYGEKVHYALELIQNAEDAGSSSITFIFEKDQIIVINDGEIFGADDVDAICSVKPGRKKNKIGFFGVGFKSVFNVTSIPQVISSDFNFYIKNYIYPSPAEKIPESANEHYFRDKGSVFILPESEGLPSIPELIENFKEIDDKILLFLNNLKVLHFIDKVNDETWSIEKPPSEDDYILLKDGRSGQETKWRVFFKDLLVSDGEIPIPEGKEGITDTRIIIAFPCDENTQEANKGSTIYCYLPTKKRSDMPFLVQGDFVPTVGRGDIQDVKWNEWLLSEIGILAAEAIDGIKDDPNLNGQLYDFIPLKDEIQESLMDILADSMYKSLESKDVAKTAGGDWKLPKECVIAASPEIPEIISHEDLRSHYGRNLTYVDVELSERADTILSDLGSLFFEEEEFVDFLGKEDLIKNRSPKWFLKVYNYLSEIFDIKSKDYKGNFNWDDEKLDLFSKLQKTKFLFTNQDKLVALKDSKMPDRLICYPQVMDLSEVNSLLTEGELVFLNKYFQLSSYIKRKEDPEEEQKRQKVHDFFEGIGIRIYFKQSHVIRDAILPKFSSGKYQQYGDIKLFDFVNYIRMYWSTLESEVRNKKLSEKIFDEIKQTILLKAYRYENGKKVDCYLPPAKMYFSRRYGKIEVMEDLFEGVNGVHFLHSYYLNREKTIIKKKKRGRQRAEYGWKKFLGILGVWSSPIVEKGENWVSILGKEGYGWIKREYSPSGMHEIKKDSTSGEIPRLIEFCSTLKDSQKVKQRMEMLWESLSDNWVDYRKHCNAVYKYKYHSEYTKSLNNSSFLNYLKSAEWIPTEDGDFCKPGGVYLSSRKNKMLLGENVKFANLTGAQSFLQDIGVTIEPEIETVIDHIIEYKESNPKATKSEIKKFEIIYSYLSDKIDALISLKDDTIVEIRKIFRKNKLVYIPRKDKSWWKPYHVFWADHSKIFGNLRGYIENNGKVIYASEIKEFMSSLGIRENPTIKQALRVLEQLKDEEDYDSLKRILTKVYAYIHDTIIHDHSEKIDWAKYTFMTKKGNFFSPNEIFYEDEEEFTKAFDDKVEFIYIPHSSWVELHEFLKKAQVNSFKNNLVIKKHLGEITEAEGSEVSYVIHALELTKKYLLSKNIQAYDSLESEGVFQRLSEIEVYETTALNLDLILNKNNSKNATVKGLAKKTYYSEEENRLYVLTSTKLLSGLVAKELSRIFQRSAKEVFPFLNSILPIMDQDENLESQLSLFGIESEGDAYSGSEKVELVPENEEAESEPDEPDKKPEPEDDKDDTSTVKPPPQPKPRKGFIDPNEFFPVTATGYTPYKATEGEERKVDREINLRDGKPGGGTPYTGPKPRTGRKDAEGIALQIVINYEFGEGREAEDRHSQRGIGYDIYSKDQEGQERFIEVKHFSDKESRFELKPHQLKKAEIEGDKYYVYVVKGLKEGTTPKLFIIQNPLEWLSPDPPVRQEFSEWKSAVKEEIDFSKS